MVVSAILHNAPWTHAFLCYLCLLNLMLEHLGPAYNEYEVRRTMGRVFDTAGTLMYLQTFRRSASTRWRASAPGDWGHPTSAPEATKVCDVRLGT